MKFKLLALLLAAGASGALYAHHSFAATYFEDQSVTVEGTLVSFSFRNPHSFITLDVKDEKGEVIRWGVEWGAGGQLGRQGITRDTLKAGDHVIITGKPGRTPEDHRMRMVNLKRPADGLNLGGAYD